jgi:hypothetical protein
MTKVEAAYDIGAVQLAQGPPYAITSAEAQPDGRIRVRGKAPNFDDTHMLVNNELAGVTPTSPENTPIDGIPGNITGGNEFGFDILVDSTDIQNWVCIAQGAYGVNIPRACTLVTVASRSSDGLAHADLNSVTAANGVIHVVGWALVSRLRDPVGVDLDVGLGDKFYSVVGLDPTDVGMSRPDVGAAYPVAGPNHGFSVDIPVDGPGEYNVCTDQWETEESLTHMNVAVTILEDLGTCRDVTVPPF